MESSSTPELNEQQRRLVQAWRDVTVSGWETGGVKDDETLKRRIISTTRTNDAANLHMLLTTFYGLGLAYPDQRQNVERRLGKLANNRQLSLLDNPLQDLYRVLWYVQGDPDTYQRAMFDFLRELRMAAVISEPVTPSKKTQRDYDNQEYSVTHWMRPLVGPSLGLLIDKVREYDRRLNLDPLCYYSKSLSFIQSSGVGKSRLADEYGRHIPMVTYVLRKEGDSGYPLADVAIRRFLRRVPDETDQKHLESPESKILSEREKDVRRDNVWYHAQILGLLQATFDCFCEEVNRFLAEEQVASVEVSLSRVAEITRSKFDKPNRQAAGNEQDAFCEQVAERALAIAKSAVRDSSFRAALNHPDEAHARLSDSIAMGGLYEAVDNLENALTPFRSEDSHDPRFVLVIDEISSIEERLTALQRMISLVSKCHSIWYFFLSTKSQLDTMLPPDHAMREGPIVSQPSFRGGGQRMLFPPFTSFAIDIEELDRGFRVRPSSDSVAAFATARHMSKFGRPLWSAYDRPEDIASLKLLGGMPSYKYSPENRDHVFALLSVRLCLDVNLANPVTRPLSQTAVNLHLRLVTFVDPATGLLQTRTPAEPVVAASAMRILCDGSNWEMTLKHFAGDLLSHGVVDKGSKGELYSRLMLILARDALVSQSSSKGPAKHICPTFTVVEFLSTLFGNRYRAELETIDKEILEAHLNFVMFTKTEKHLAKDDFGKLCYILLRRGAALQLAPQQPTYDQFIPFYCGNPNEPYDLKKAGAILIHVKNKAKESTPAEILGEVFFRGRTARDTRGRAEAQRSNKERIIFSDMKVKLLLIVFDLGVDRKTAEKVEKVEVSCSRMDKPKIWAIHSRGHGGNVFGCIRTMSVQSGAAEFFTNAFHKDGDNPIAIRHDADLLDDVQCHEIFEEAENKKRRSESDR